MKGRIDGTKRGVLRGKKAGNHVNNAIWRRIEWGKKRKKKDNDEQGIKMNERRKKIRKLRDTRRKERKGRTEEQVNEPEE